MFKCLKNPFTLREWFYVVWLIGATLLAMHNSVRLHNLETRRQDHIKLDLKAPASWRERDD